MQGSSYVCTAGKSEELILASCSQTEPQHSQFAAAEADQHSSHASISVHNGSFSSSIADAVLLLNQEIVSSIRNAPPPILQSMPAKRRSFVTWALPQTAEHELHQGLLSAAHAAEKQMLLLPSDSYRDTEDVVFAPDHNYWGTRSNRLAALWQLICWMAGSMKYWVLCCPNASGPSASGEDIVKASVLHNHHSVLENEGLQQP